MIAEVGHFALILALFCAFFGAVVPLYGAYKGDAGLMAIGKGAAYAQFAAALIAFGALLYSFVISGWNCFNFGNWDSF